MTLRRREVRLRRIINKKDTLIEADKKRIRALQMWKWRRQKKGKPILLKRVEEIEKKGSKEIRKNLLEYEVLKEQLKESKAVLKTKQGRSIFCQVMAGKVIEKYKMISTLSKLISLKSQRKYSGSLKLIVNNYRKEKQVFGQKLRETVKNFLERVKNSAMSPAIKDAICKNKIYYRKRYLLDTMDNLHKKHNSEEPIKISRTLFYRFKPFWIIHKKESERDTCLCKTHANFDLILKKMHSLKL